MIKFYIFFYLMFVYAFAFSQDLHFSNYNAIPILLNPGSAGVQNSDIRFITNYRNQWGTVSSPFKTMYASIDASLYKSKNASNCLGAALSAYNDKAGSSRMGTNAIQVSVSNTRQLSASNYVSLGLQAGLAEKSLNAQNLIWDNQIVDGTYNANIASGEASMSSMMRYAEFGSGILWNYIGEDDLKANAGIAIHGSGTPFNASGDKQEKSPLKLTLHTTWQIPVPDKKTYILPTLSIIKKGVSQEVLLGGLVRYDVGDDSRYTSRNISSSVYLGAIYRNRDAIILLSRLDYKKILSFSLAYDINISGLNRASSSYGGFELSLTYLGAFRQALKTGKSFL